MNAKEYILKGGPGDGVEVSTCGMKEGSTIKYPALLQGGIWQDAFYEIKNGEAVFTGKYEEQTLKPAARNSLHEFLESALEDEDEQD